MTFTNPIIPGFHPDPSICRAGREFFGLYASGSGTTATAPAFFEWFDYQVAAQDSR